MDSPSSWIGQFHKKKASRVPKSPGLSFGTIEWSCPGIMKVKSENKPVKSREKKLLHKETSLKAFGVQFELKNTRKHSRGVLIELGSRNKQDPFKVISTY